MKNPNNILLGAILILLGGFLLGITNQWFPFELSLAQVSKFWPFLIILGGVAILLDKRKNVWNPTTLLLILLAIPLGIYSFTNTKIKMVKNELKKEFDFDVNINDEDGIEFSESDSANLKFDHRSFKVENKSYIQTVDLKISGGAAQFLLEQPDTQNLFLADTKLAKNTNFSLKDKVDGNNAEIEFKMKSAKNIRFDDKEITRKVAIKMNPEPIWNIKMEIGAGDLSYDFTPYKVKNFKIETGASNVDLKLGDLIDESKVEIKSGVANIVIKVPENVGCEISVDGALNSKNFSGFKKINSKLYRTEGFDETSKKIYIDTDSGMSNIVISRY